AAGFGLTSAEGTSNSPRRTARMLAADVTRRLVRSLLRECMWPASFVRRRSAPAGPAPAARLERRAPHRRDPKTLQFAHVRGLTIDRDRVGSGRDRVSRPRPGGGRPRRPLVADWPPPSTSAPRLAAPRERSAARD